MATGGWLRSMAAGCVVDDGQKQQMAVQQFNDSLLKI